MSIFREIEALYARFEQVEIEHLVQRAREVRQNAYAPYSDYKVGACALASDNSVHCGCNLENASYGLTVCAERNAIAAMVANGHLGLQAIALVTSDGGTPCGACRQVLVEFARANLDCAVIVATPSEILGWTTVEDLLPNSFQLPPNENEQTT
jgi:cytidine deaminase